MKPGSKYSPLFEYLRDRKRDGAEEVALTFSQIEKLLGRALPEGARVDKGWWSNREGGSSQSEAWLEAGYKVRNISVTHKNVTFGPKVFTPQYTIRRDGDTVLFDANLIKALRMHMDMTQTEFAEYMGVRQQTVSEWETGMYEPTRATCKHLMFVAEKATFSLDTE